MNWEKKTVLVTGSKGFLGSFVVKELEKLYPKKILSYSSEELDLRNNSNCKKAVHHKWVLKIFLFRAISAKSKKSLFSVSNLYSIFQNWTFYFCPFFIF